MIDTSSSDMSLPAGGVPEMVPVMVWSSPVPRVVTDRLSQSGALSESR